MTATTLRKPVDVVDSRREKHILDAMYGLVLRLGYRKVCMQDVANEAHVGKGTIYLHWSSKDELFDALLLRETDRVRTQLGTTLRRRPDLVDFGHTAALLYQGMMSDPLLRAYNRGDATVLGIRACRPGCPDRLGISLVSSLSHPGYVGLLRKHELVTDDADSEPGRVAIGAIVGGFVLRPDGEEGPGQYAACAKLLGMTLGRSFGRTPNHRRSRCEAALAEMVTPDRGWMPSPARDVDTDR